MARGSRTALAPVFGLALATATCGGAGAQPRPTVFGGVGLGADELAYAGLTLPLASTGPGGGVALRTMVSRSINDYRSAGRRIESEQRRGEASLLYQAFGRWGYVDAGLGARYTDTDLTPQDLGNPNRGGRWDPVVSLSGESSPDRPWQTAGYAAYGFKSEDYYARAELTRAVRPSLRLGAEVILDGDPNYDRRRVGAVLAIGRSGWQVRAAVGAADSDAKDGAYGSIGFRRSF